MMKKFKLFLLAFISICAFVFLTNPQAKADDATVSTVDGASIRITEPSGLRFIGQVTGNFTGTTVKYGFLLSKGDFTASQMQELYAHSYAKAVDAGELDGEGKFYVSIVNIPASGYDDDICALAYVDVDGVKTYATSSCTRNIEEVINAIDPAERNEYMNRIINTSTFNLNGGDFVYSKSFKIGAFNGGTDGTHGIIVGNISNIKTAVYWYKIAIKQSSINSKIYEIVDTAASGKQFTTEEPYDYCIAAYVSNNADYSLLSNIGGNRSNYIFIDSLATNGTVNADTDVDKLLGNKVYCASGSQLPSATKDYYVFNGWYDNAGLTGDPITIHSVDGPEVYYAKYTPIDYTLSYDLQGGSCSESTSDVIFNVESSTITLPAAGTMSRSDYEFIEWNTRSDGTGNALTTLPTGSHGDTTVYAIWASVLPTPVVLSDNDTAAIRALSPNYFVSSTFVAGRFEIDGNVYEVGNQLYTTISAAITAATAGQKIYLFAGTYTEATISLTKNVTIAGPNYGIHANVDATSLSSVRGNEAVIHDSQFNCSGRFTFDGVKLTGTTCFNYYGTGMTIHNVVSTAKGRKLYSNSEVIQLGGATSGVNIQYNYFDFSSSARPIRSESWTATNFVFSNNYCKSTTNIYDMIRIHTFAGTCDINGNYLEVMCSNWAVFDRTSIAGATFNFKNNHIKAMGASNYSGVGFYGLSDATTLNIVGNIFENVTGTVLQISADTNNPTINMTYNQFIGNAKLNITTGTTNLTCTKNYHSVDYNNIGGYSVTGSGDFATIDALEDEYASLN